MALKIAVFCSSSANVSAGMKADAAELGRWIGLTGSTLVYGGISAGLMGIVAEETRASGGHVIGVVPESRREKANPRDHETVMVADLHERKCRMENMADVFIALPGGYGTLDEIISTWASLGFNGETKPLILLDTEGYYEPLRQLMQNMQRAGLLTDKHASELTFSPTVKSTIGLLETFNR